MQVSLLELQQGILHALTSGGMDTVAPWIATADPAARVEIYRRNSRTNLCNALRNDYPVVERLVGSEFFAQAACDFVAANPSLSGDVGDYGKGFPGFIATYPPAASLPYLQDVARLELAWAEVFLAPDPCAKSSIAEFSGLAAIPEEDLGAIRFEFNPALRMLASDYPVLTIWQVNQPGYTGDQAVSLDANGEWVLLRRRGNAVELHPLAPGEYAWLLALNSGACLEEAVEAAFVAQADFDFSSSLHQHLIGDTFAGFLKKMEILREK
jgi:hypothetical protein